MVSKKKKRRQQETSEEEAPDFLEDYEEFEAAGEEGIENYFDEEES